VVIGILVLGAAISLAQTLPSESWTISQAPGSPVRVLSDADPRSAAVAASQVASFEQSLRRRFTWMPIAATPLLIVASNNELTVRSLAADSGESEASGLSSYLVGTTQHLGAFKTGLPEPGDRERSPYRAFYRGRAHVLVTAGLGSRAPAWVAHGLAAFLADSVVKEKEVQAGRLGALLAAAGPAVPQATDLFKDRAKPDARLDPWAALFIHYLLAGEGGKNSAAFDGLLRAIAASDTAATQTAQANVAALFGGFAKYATAKRFNPVKLPVEPPVPSSSFAVKQVSLADSAMMRAEILFELNRPVDARTLLRVAEAAEPKLARPYEIEAVLYEREQRSAEARKAIDAAIERGSKNGALYYRLAQLQWARTMPKSVLASVQSTLETAQGLSPDDASVLAYLADIQGDLGAFDAALETAKRGAALASSDFYPQMVLARAQWNAKQPDAALATAKSAALAARVASQKQRAQEFQTFVTRNRKAPKPWTTQFGPPPAGAFGATAQPATAGGGTRVGTAARTDSGDASAVADCFAKRDDAACSRAVPSLETACNEKQATSCVSLGSLYEGGFGVTRDRRRSATFYKTACDLGDRAGCARYASLEARGLGVAKNEARATKTLESLCADNVPEGCVGLALFLQQTGYATDRDRANVVLKKACDAGYAEACGLMTVSR
jgi:TPR repeat protein